MNYVEPEISKSAFHCPICGTYAHMDWFRFGRNQTPKPYTEAECSHCKKCSLWRIEKTENRDGYITPTKGIMLFPGIIRREQMI